MCGIYGWSWKSRPSFRQRDILARALGALNDERGGHSWGWYRTDNFKMTKGLGEIKRVSRCLAGANEVLAHTRFATTGEKTIRNAHPFDIGNLVGAHNGVFYNHSWVAHKYDIDKYEVDSEVLLHLIAQNKPTEDLMGYGTVEFHKKGTPGIYLAKLSAGADLAVADTKYGVVWSSSSTHLTLALNIAGLYGYSMFDIKHGELVHAVHGKLFTSTTELMKVDSSGVPTSRSWRGHMYGSGWDMDEPYWSRDYKTPGTTVKDLFPDKENKEAEPSDDSPPLTNVDVSSYEECDYCGVPLMEKDVMVAEYYAGRGEPVLCSDCNKFEDKISKGLGE